MEANIRILVYLLDLTFQTYFQRRASKGQIHYYGLIQLLPENNTQLQVEHGVIDYHQY